MKNGPLKLSIFAVAPSQSSSVSIHHIISKRACLLIGIVSDPQEGILIESFEYRTSSGFQFTVVSDSQD